MGAQENPWSEAKAPRSRRPSATIALLILAVVGLGAWWRWSLGEEDRTIRNLSPAGRAAFYQRTLENLETLCEGSEGPQLEDFCAKEAKRIQLFPECDDRCHTMARHYLPGARP